MTKGSDYTKKYQAKRDAIMLRPSKEDGTKIRQAAADAGMSVQGFMFKLFNDYMECHNEKGEKKMNPTHEKLVYDSIAEKRTYSFHGFRPYGAADLLTMDSYVDESFAGNVPEEIVRNGGAWDAEKHILWMPGKAGYAMFVEEV